MGSLLNEYIATRKRRAWKKKQLSTGSIYCAYCAIELTNFTATVDHVIPKHLGGKDRISNYLLACGPCNGQRGKETRMAGFVKDACFRCNEHHKGPCPMKEIKNDE